MPYITDIMGPDGTCMNRLHHTNEYGMYHDSDGGNKELGWREWAIVEQMNRYKHACMNIQIVVLYGEITTDRVAHASL